MKGKWIVTAGMLGILAAGGCLGYSVLHGHLEKCRMEVAEKMICDLKNCVLAYTMDALASGRV